MLVSDTSLNSCVAVCYSSLQHQRVLSIITALTLRRADVRHVVEQLHCCLQELRQAVMNGAEKHPGAVAVEDEFGRVVSLTAFDQQVPVRLVAVDVHNCSEQVHATSFYALWPSRTPCTHCYSRYCAYLTLGEGTCLMNEHMSELISCLQGWTLSVLSSAA